MIEIQKPVLVDIRDVANQYGSHFSVLSTSMKKKDREPPYKHDVAVFEEIGLKDGINIWKHEHERLESAIKSCQLSISLAAGTEALKYKHETSSLMSKYILLRQKLGLMNKSAIDRIQAYKDKNQKAIELSTMPRDKIEVDVVLLEGQVRMPEKLPVKNRDYFLLNISRLDIKIKKVQLSEVLIYDNRDTHSSDVLLNDYDFYINHYFSEVGVSDGPAECVEFSDLIRSNGSQMKAHSSNSYIFENEADAIDFSIGVASEKITKMETELESMKKFKENLVSMKVEKSTFSQ